VFIKDGESRMLVSKLTIIAADCEVARLLLAEPSLHAAGLRLISQGCTSSDVSK